MSALDWANKERALIALHPWEFATAAILALGVGLGVMRFIDATEISTVNAEIGTVTADRDLARNCRLEQSTAPKCPVVYEKTHTEWRTKIVTNTVTKTAIRIVYVPAVPRSIVQVPQSGLGNPAAISPQSSTVAIADTPSAGNISVSDVSVCGLKLAPGASFSVLHGAGIEQGSVKNVHYQEQCSESSAPLAPIPALAQLSPSDLRNEVQIFVSALREVQAEYDAATDKVRSIPIPKTASRAQLDDAWNQQQLEITRLTEALNQNFGQKFADRARMFQTEMLYRLRNRTRPTLSGEDHIAIGTINSGSVWNLNFVAAYLMELANEIPE